MEPNKTYRGIDLLEKVLEFSAMTPNENEWNYKSLSYNQPREIRLRQIHSLLKAFSLMGKEKTILEKAGNYFNPDLKAEINSVLYGNFLEDKTPAEYSELIYFAKQFLQKTGDSFDLSKEVRQTELTFIYSKIIRVQDQVEGAHGF
jgi:hypothetical protein